VNNLSEAVGYVYVSEMKLDEANKDIKIIRIIALEDSPIASDGAK
jgi:hypothetical protein